MKRLLGVLLVLCGFAGVCLGEEKSERFEGVWRGLGGTTPLAHGVIYESKGKKGIETVLVMSERPVNRGLLLKSLTRDGTDRLVIPESTQIKLTLDAGGKVIAFETVEKDGTSTSRLSGGVSEAESREYQVEMKRERGRVEGRVVYPREGTTASKVSLSGFELKFAGEVIRIPAEVEENIKRAAEVPAPFGKVTGTLKATHGDKKSKPVSIELKHVVVYESYFFDKDLHLDVLMSDQPIPLKELRDELASKGEGECFFTAKGTTVHLEYRDGVLHLSRIFVKGGDWQEQWVQTDLIQSKITVKEGRVSGGASQKLVPKGEKPKNSFGPKGTLEFETTFEGELMVVPEFEERKKQVAAKEAEPQGKVTGKLEMEKGKFPLTHGVAYRMKDSNHGDCLCVVLGPKHIDAEKLRKTVGAKPIEDTFFHESPYVRFLFDENGDCCQSRGMVYAQKVSYNLFSDAYVGKVKIEQGRVTGKVKNKPPEAPFGEGDWIVEATFDVELIEGTAAEVKREEPSVVEDLAGSLFSLPESVWDLAGVLWVFLKMFGGWGVD